MVNHVAIGENIIYILQYLSLI